jgi:hypothetical protein
VHRNQKNVKPPIAETPPNNGKFAQSSPQPSIIQAT